MPSAISNNPSQTNGLSLDILTIIAIGLVSFIFKNVLHEAVGHGGGCLLVGGVPLTLSTAHFDCGYQSVSGCGVRFVAAAGTLVNFIAAYFFWLAFRSPRVKSPTWRYFFWLAMSGNFFAAAGYPLFSGLIGVGDWVDVVQGFQPAWFWRLLLTLSGLILYVVGVWLSLREIVTLIGSHPTERLGRAFRLTLVPYLAGSTAASIGALLNPIGLFVAFTSAAASFGGSSALAWMSQMLKTKWFPEKSESLILIERNWTWIVLASIFLVGHIVVLGPGVQFK
jgi:hypothetical protein